MSGTTGRDTDQVRHYINEGIKPVKLNGRNRKPVGLEWQLKTFPLEDIEAHVRGGGGLGLQCGEVSGWLSVVDLDTPEARRLAPEFLPDTLLQAKGEEEPSHYFYRSPGLGYAQFADLDGSEIIALKASDNGRGHQVVVEPTRHPTKGPYRFVGGFNPAAIAHVDKDVLRKRTGMLATAALVARQIPAAREEGGGGRHAVVLALAGFMLRNGEAAEDVEKILLGAWAARGASREAVEDVRRSVRDTAARLERNEPATGGRTLEELIPGLPAKIAKFLGWAREDHRELRQSYARSDLGNAERFVDMHGGRVRYCPTRKAWLVYDGTRWRWDVMTYVVKLAHEAARAIHAEAAAEPDLAKQREIAKFAISSQNEGRINGLLSQAKPYLAVGMDELDRDPWAINCANGTLDLRTGKLRPHNPEDLITRLAPVEYNPAAACARFRQFLKETLVDDAVISFVKRYSGYTLTGITRERVFAILWGSGKNGKTTLVEILHSAMGDYATNTDTETILAKRYQGVGNDVAALKGARFVSAAEVEKGQRLAEGKVKQLTGSDTVTARFLFGEPFDFKPQFHLWLSTNNKPVIQGTDDAIWDRIRLVPFTQRFDGNDQDPKLPDKLQAELPGIFAWMVEGCLEWQEHGLGEPEKMQSATDQYREEMDVLAAFFEDRCVVKPNLVAPATPLYKQYQLWCDDAGERPETQKTFGMRLRERGFESVRVSSGPHKDRKGWRGVGIKADHPDPDAPPKDARDADNAPALDNHRPLSEPSTDDRPLSENAGFAEETSVVSDVADHSEPKNQNLPYAKPREGELLEKRSASSASSAGTPVSFDLEGSQSSTVAELSAQRAEAQPQRRLTEEEVLRVQKYIREGMKPELARAEVLGKAAS